MATLAGAEDEEARGAEALDAVCAGGATETDAIVAGGGDVSSGFGAVTGGGAGGFGTVAAGGEGVVAVVAAIVVTETVVVVTGTLGTVGAVRESVGTGGNPSANTDDAANASNPIAARQVTMYIRRQGMTHPYNAPHAPVGYGLLRRRYGSIWPHA